MKKCYRLRIRHAQQMIVCIGFPTMQRSSILPLPRISESFLKNGRDAFLHGSDLSALSLPDSAQLERHFRRCRHTKQTRKKLTKFPDGAPVSIDHANCPRFSFDRRRHSLTKPAGFARLLSPKLRYGLEKNAQETSQSRAFCSVCSLIYFSRTATLSVRLFSMKKRQQMSTVMIENGHKTSNKKTLHAP